MLFCHYFNRFQDPQRDKNYPRLEGDFLELECHKVIGDNGYCGTCLPFAKKGYPGYCGDDEATEEKNKTRWEREKPRPSGWGGWGLCDPMCRQVQFTGYSLLPLDLKLQCKLKDTIGAISQC